MKLTTEERTQSSPEWLELRKTKVTASDIVVLLGHGKYDVKTPLQLYNKKKGYTPETPDNPAMAQGRALEAVIVGKVQERTGLLLLPDVLVSNNNVFLASLDGISPDNEVIVEVKYVGKAAYDNFVDQADIPPHHYWQMVGQFICCPTAGRIIYAISNDGESVKQVDVIVKEEDVEAAVKAGQDFYANYLQPNKSPPLTDKDSVELMDDDAIAYAAMLADLLDDEVILKASIADARALLLKVTGERNCVVGGLRITVAQGRRVIDYKAAMKDHSIDAELYTKQSTKNVVTIRRAKQ